MTVADPKFNPSGNTAVTQIKEMAVALETFITATVPPGRRRSIALTKLEEASMWAVKAAVVGDE